MSISYIFYDIAAFVIRGKPWAGESAGEKEKSLVYGRHRRSIRIIASELDCLTLSLQKHIVWSPSIPPWNYTMNMYMEFDLQMLNGAKNESAGPSTIRVVDGQNAIRHRAIDLNMIMCQARKVRPEIYTSFDSGRVVDLSHDFNLNCSRLRLTLLVEQYLDFSARRSTLPQSMIFNRAVIS
jgi:hypothetical protein